MIEVVLFVLAVISVVGVVVAIVYDSSDKEKTEENLQFEIEKYCKDYIDSNLYCNGLDRYFKPYKEAKDAIIGMEGRCKLGYYDSYTEEEKQFVLQHYKELQQKIKNMDDKYPLFKDVYDIMRKRKTEEHNRKIKEQKINALCFPEYPRKRK